MFVIKLILSVLALGPALAAVPITTEVTYDNGHWIGTVSCQFTNESDCSLSMHVSGRRIDVDSHLANEDVFTSCVSSDTSIALAIYDFVYDEIQDYYCLDDITGESNHAWLVPQPEVILQGVEVVGAQVRLICNSIGDSPLYWILPGSQVDNADVIVVQFINENNSSASASFRLDDNDNFAEYKCCIQLRDDQDFQPLCDSHTFILDGSPQLIETYENYRLTNALNMQCVFRSYPAPDPQLVQWQQCTSDSCTVVYDDYFTIEEDNDKYTLNTTLKISYSSTVDHYICFYENLNYTFNVNLTTYAPEIQSIDKQVYYSTDGYAVKLGCLIYSSPNPDIYWTKTVFNDESEGYSEVVSVGNYAIETTQTADDQWQTNLIIYPYDSSVDNAFFTCSANNSYGCKSVQLDTTDGPNNLELDMLTNYNATYKPTTLLMWGSCIFQMFPSPPTYEFNILSALDVPYNISISQNDQLSQVTLAYNFAVNTSMYPITVECNAFNRFNPEQRLVENIIVDNNNFTTPGPTTASPL